MQQIFGMILLLMMASTTMMMMMHKSNKIMILTISIAESNLSLKRSKPIAWVKMTIISTISMHMIKWCWLTQIKHREHQTKKLKYKWLAFFFIYCSSPSFYFVVQWRRTCTITKIQSIIYFLKESSNEAIIIQ